MAKKLIIVRKKKSTYGILNIGKFLQEPPSCSWKKTITTTMRVRGLNGPDEGRRVKSSKKAKRGLFLCYRKQPFRWPLVGF